MINITYWMNRSQTDLSMDCFIEINLDVHVIVGIYEVKLCKKNYFYFRIIFAAGRDNVMPEWLSFLHVNNLSPVPAILFTVSC